MLFHIFYFFLLFVYINFFWLPLGQTYFPFHSKQNNNKTKYIETSKMIIQFFSNYQRRIAEMMEESLNLQRNGVLENVDLSQLQVS